MTRRAKTDLAALDALAAPQHRCLTLAQLRAAGVPSGTVAGRTRPIDGRWTRVLPGVVLLHRGEPTRDERASAALLYAGPGSVLTGVESLWRQGLRRTPAVVPDIHVLIPHDRRRVSVAFVVCERTGRLARASAVGGYPCTPVARALVDASRRCPDLGSVRAATAEAVQRRMCAQQDLLDEVAWAQRRGTARIRLVAQEIVGGVRSAVEADFRQLVLAAGLPAALYNHDVVTSDGELVGCPDAWFDDAALAVEVDSREWHLDPEGWERTQSKRARFARFGVATIPVTPRRLYRERADLVADLRGALRRAAVAPRPDVSAVMRSQAA